MQANDLIFIAEAHTGLKTQLVNASLVAATEYRLDAPAFLARQNVDSLLQFSGQGQTVSDLAEVFTVYIQSPVLAYVKPFANSRPYMTTSELAEFENGRATHVSLTADPRLIGWEIKEGNIVVSRSGRVGEAYWVDKRLDGVLVGDSFRVVPKKEDDRFFLYALLSSSMARDFLSGSAYGSVVDHASLDQLRRFPIPPVSSRVKKQVSEKARHALQSREEAYDLIDKAQGLLHRVNSLSPLPQSPASTLDEFSFDHSIISSNELLESSGISSEFRLEAHFYNPISRAAINSIRSCPSQNKTLGELTERVFFCNRFTRTYVEAKHGIPYLAGKNIVQIRPRIEHYLSISETAELDSYKLQRGWTLITCSGTIGRTCFVWSNFEKYVATHDLIRVVPDENKIDPGYLHTFFSLPYGYEQIMRFRHGSVIDHVTPGQMEKVIVPLPSPAEQKEIGDKVRLAYEKRAEALRLEDQAQEILMRAIKGDNIPENQHV